VRQIESRALQKLHSRIGGDEGGVESGPRAK
jgi:hypothetical protein